MKKVPRGRCNDFVPNALHMLRAYSFVVVGERFRDHGSPNRMDSGIGLRDQRGGRLEISPRFLQAQGAAMPTEAQEGSATRIDHSDCGPSALLHTNMPTLFGCGTPLKRTGDGCRRVVFVLLLPHRRTIS